MATTFNLSNRLGSAWASIKGACANLLPPERVRSDSFISYTDNVAPVEVSAVADKSRRTGLWDVTLVRTVYAYGEYCIPLHTFTDLGRGKSPTQVTQLFKDHVRAELCAPASVPTRIVQHPGDYRQHPEFKQLNA